MSRVDSVRVRGVILFAPLVMTAFAGCWDHCGPQLTGLEFTAMFPATWDRANRSQAEDVLADMGFRPHQKAPGWFEKEGLEGMLLMDEDDNGTRVLFRVDHEWIDYPTMEGARAAGMATATPHWAGFNSTVDDFAKRMMWTPPMRTEAESQVLIC